MDFREVTALLHLAAVEIRAASFSSATIELVISRDGSSHEHAVSFAGVETLKWKPAAEGESSPIDTAGLEKLGDGEAWRLYLQTAAGAELELSARTILCDGSGVTGIGRSYRH